MQVPAKAITVLFFLLLIAPAAAHAQSSADPAWTAGGIVGLGRTWDDESQIGSGVLLGARLDGRLAGGLWVEGSLDWLRHNRDEGAFRAVGHTTLLGAALKGRFGSAATHGYVLGGAVIAFHAATNTFDGVARDLDSTDAGISLGGGFAGTVGGQFAIGPEARMTILWAGDDSAPAYAIYGGVRIL
jgi:Outer membrane protein beta-barrel domain